MKPPFYPKRRGRPPVEEPRSTVSTWLPSKYHDQLIELAKRREVSVSAYVRSVIIMRLKP